MRLNIFMSCSDHITPPTGHMPAVYRCQNPSIHMKFLSLCAFEHELVSSEYLFLWIMKAGSSDDALNDHIWHFNSRKNRAHLIFTPPAY